MPLEHPLRVGFPPHVPAVGALWDEADLVDRRRLRPRRHEHPELGAAAAAARCARSTSTPTTRPRTTASTRTVGLRRRPATASRGRTSHAVRARGVPRRWTPRALRFLDALEFALPHDADRGLRHVHPRLLDRPASIRSPSRASCSTRWAGGRSGFGFPAAIGAALADTGPTVALCGDGGFLFACGELATVAQEQIPLTTVIVDDGGYGMLRFDQDQAGEPRFGVDLHTPDFAALADVVRRPRGDGRGPRRRRSARRSPRTSPTPRRGARREGGGAHAPADHLAAVVPPPLGGGRRFRAGGVGRGRVGLRLRARRRRRAPGAGLASAGFSSLCVQVLDLVLEGLDLLLALARTSRTSGPSPAPPCPAWTSRTSPPCRTDRS